MPVRLYVDDPVFQKFQTYSSVLTALFGWMMHCYSATVEISRQANCIWIIVDAPICNIRVLIEITECAISVVAKIRTIFKCLDKGLQMCYNIDSQIGDSL